MPQSDNRRSAQRFAPRLLVDHIGRVVPPEGRFSLRVFIRSLASLGITFQVAFPDNVESYNVSSAPHHPYTVQAIRLDGGVEIHVLLAGYVNVGEWEDSTGSDPDADGRYYPENGSLADESEDPPAKPPQRDSTDESEDPSVDEGSNDDSHPQGFYGYVSDDSPRDIVYANTSGISNEYQGTDSDSTNTE